MMTLSKLFKMECVTCESEFNSLSSSCGTGYSWTLHKCPNCGQLHAKALGDTGYVPSQVKNDKKVICI